LRHSVDYNVEDVDHDNAGNHSGIKGNVYAGSVSYCLRVSSLAVLGTRTVEFGWVLGYYPQTSTQSGGCIFPGNYTTTPRLFSVYIDGAGNNHCVDRAINLTIGTYALLRLSDTNEDGEWGVFKDAGELLPRIVTDFSQGDAITNAERDNTGDVASAHFKDLQSINSGPDCCFHMWKDQEFYTDGDPGFYWHKISNPELEVLSG
jgi:hypothetical protein